jgi:multiple sugar transport system permease protein
MARQRSEARPSDHGQRRRSSALAYALLTPSLFGVTVFLLLPMFVVGWLSVHRWDLLGPIRYVGLDNWRSVLDDGTFGNSLVVTGMFVALVVPVQTALGLLAASMLARQLPGSTLFRTVYVLPWVCAPLAIAVLWRWLLAPTDGAVNTLLGHRVEWLTDPGLVLPVVSAVMVWSNVGYVTLFFLAGILAIPTRIHDAARMDGATAAQRFFRITLPMLRPTMFFVLVTGIIIAAQVFDTVYALTGGGPRNRTDLVSHRIYEEAFGAAAVGRAAVMALILFAILVVATVMQHLYFRRRISYDLT